MSDDRVEANRAAWDKYSDTYQAQHGRSSTRAAATPGGSGRSPSPSSRARATGGQGRARARLRCGAVVDRDRQRGARPVGIDLSAKQLEHGRRAVKEARVDVELVEASAPSCPSKSSFDLVFCDHGAMDFTDPLEMVPEVARVLRPGGMLVFSHASPFYELFWDIENDAIAEELKNDYFGMHAMLDPSDGMWEYNLPHGEWMKLFRENGLLIEELMELRPADDATSSYDFVPHEWARRWPAEEIWRVRKEAE